MTIEMMKAELRKIRPEWKASTIDSWGRPHPVTGNIQLYAIYRKEMDAWHRLSKETQDQLLESRRAAARLRTKNLRRSKQLMLF